MFLTQLLFGRGFCSGWFKSLFATERNIIVMVYFAKNVYQYVLWV